MINVLFFLKPIVDMLWQYTFLDVILFLILSCYLFVNHRRIKFTMTSVLLLIFFLLITRSFLAQIDTSTINIYIKLVSTLMIFVAAQINQNPLKTVKIIALSCFVPLSINVILALTGKGYIYWGSVYTFTGTYFYKTDLAIAVVIGVIFLRYFLLHAKNKFMNRIAFLYIFLISPYLILTANSRTLLVIYAITIIFIVGEFLKVYRIKTRHLKFKLSSGVRVLLVLIVLLFVGSTYVTYNNALAEGNSLTINFEHFFTEENTQGRTNIWSSAIDVFSKSSLFNISVGHHINSDFNMTITNQDAHNNLLKILINFGIIGVIVFIIFMARTFFLVLKATKLKNKNNDTVFILNTIILLFIFFNLEGMAQSNIIYTQSTWYSFYFFGLLNNKGLFKTDTH